MQLLKSLSAALIGFSLLVNAPAGFAASKNIDGIAAIVNNDIITTSELNQKLNAAKDAAIARHLRLPSTDSLREEVLKHIIDSKLQMAVAKRAGVEASEADVLHAIKSIAEQNHLTEKTLRQQVTKTGISFATYKKELRQQIILQKLQHRILDSKVHPSASEIDNAMKEIPLPQTHVAFHLQHILLAFPANADEAAKTKVKQQAIALDKELQQGANFTKLALENSNGPNAHQGGDWGWKSANDLPQVFVKNLENLKIGKVSPPIKTGNGYHLLKLIAKKTSGTQTYVTEYKVKHILLKVDANQSSAVAHTKIEKLRHDIEKGKPFAAVAKQYSQDPGSASHGGSLGWVTLKSLVPHFADAVKSLHKGKLSQPVKSRFGWHLIVVEGSKKVNMANEIRRREATELVYQRKFSHAVQNWIKDLRKQAYIKVVN